MPRPRSFDEAEVLQCAMMTFWRLGYDATTYRVLEAETGVGVRSMHNTFGEKEELFVRSLETYREMAAGLIAQIFDPPGLAAIEMLFVGASTPAEAKNAIENSGCLMVNSVFELAELPPAVDAEVMRYRTMWREAFEDALRADAVDEPEARAEFLVGALWGVLSQIRLARDKSAARSMTDVIVQTVRSWSVQ
ncbi:MAG: TetR/AcrR family transcriptional regulator [Myxococcota bacterium]